ncbi:MAG: hypothetical protein RIB53_03115 [Roseitalea porphyridii]|uniref:hypothetical protein n=1 Tax=Roseitalea porphyridii TaxID=1852022 RepID=UPI0032EC19DB
MRAWKWITALAAAIVPFCGNELSAAAFQVGGAKIGAKGDAAGFSEDGSVSRHPEKHQVGFFIHERRIEIAVQRGQFGLLTRVAARQEVQCRPVPFRAVKEQLFAVRVIGDGKPSDDLQLNSGALAHVLDLEQNNRLQAHVEVLHASVAKSHVGANLYLPHLASNFDGFVGRSDGLIRGFERPPEDADGVNAHTKGASRKYDHEPLGEVVLVGADNPIDGPWWGWIIAFGFVIGVFSLIAGAGYLPMGLILYVTGDRNEDQKEPRRQNKR